MSARLRIQVVSDLHFDVARAELRLAPGADVLVVAGDTCEGVERGFAWLRAAVPTPVPIVAVAGNHEHYRHVLPEGLARGRAVAAHHGIAFLENDAAVTRAWSTTAMATAERTRASTIRPSSSRSSDRPIAPEKRHYR